MSGQHLAEGFLARGRETAFFKVRPERVAAGWGLQLPEVPALRRVGFAVMVSEKQYGRSQLGRESGRDAAADLGRSSGERRGS